MLCAKTAKPFKSILDITRDKEALEQMSVCMCVCTKFYVPGTVTDPTLMKQDPTIGPQI